MNVCLSILQPSIWWKVRCHNEAKALIEMFVVESDPLFFRGCVGPKDKWCGWLKKTHMEVKYSPTCIQVFPIQHRAGETKVFKNQKNSALIESLFYETRGGGSWSASTNPRHWQKHLLDQKKNKPSKKRRIRKKKRIGRRTSGTFSFTRPTSRPFENKESSGALVTYWLYLCCVSSHVMPCQAAQLGPKLLLNNGAKKTKLLRTCLVHNGGDDLCWTLSSIQNSECKFSQLRIFFTERLFHLGVSVVRVHGDWKLTSTPLNVGHWAAFKKSRGAYTPLLLDKQTSGLLMVQKSQGQPPGISKNPGDSWDFNYGSLNWWSPSTKQQIHKSQFSRRKTNGQNKRKNKTPSFFLKKAQGSLVKIKSLDLSNHLAAIPKHMTSWCLLVCFILVFCASEIDSQTIPFSSIFDIRGHLHLLGCHFNPGKSMSNVYARQTPKNTQSTAPAKPRKKTWYLTFTFIIINLVKQLSMIPC